MTCRPGPRLLLTTLRQTAGEDGWSHASVPTLAWETGQCERTIYRQLGALHLAGLLMRERRRIAGRVRTCWALGARARDLLSSQFAAQLQAEQLELVDVAGQLVVATPQQAEEARDAGARVVKRPLWPRRVPLSLTRDLGKLLRLEGWQAVMQVLRGYHAATLDDPRQWRWWPLLWRPGVWSRAAILAEDAAQRHRARLHRHLESLRPKPETEPEAVTALLMRWRHQGGTA
ncbi:hypothetical protein OV203_32270 [Nannocystis sp. ILAH1]|uniref:helix-turn-helix domain-containing protein n=1 Tax=Nannocystis sp. ILAH1 TaxID=2996789 RepID=UPI00227075D4|nr:helix-turn-helix domain-containing protein [Nannocystis sp. ILAH1]MCY0991859.1 hypothetical protein [Nannocystis sp. ILAH1]